MLSDHSSLPHVSHPIVLAALWAAWAISLTPCRADVVINEVDPDQTGTDSAEFIELYDGGVGHTSLDGFIIVLYNGSQDTVYSAIDLAGHATSSSGFFVLGNPEVPHIDLVLEPGPSGALQNGPDALALYFQRPVDAFPAGAPISQDGLVDALVYGTQDDDDWDLLQALTPGHPIQVNDNATEAISPLALG